MPAERRRHESTDSSRSLSLSSLSDEDEAWVKEALSQQQVFAIKLTPPSQSTSASDEPCSAERSNAQTAPGATATHRRVEKVRALAYEVVGDAIPISRHLRR